MNKLFSFCHSKIFANSDCTTFSLAALLTLCSLSVSATLPEPPLKANAYELPKSAQIDAFLSKLANASEHAALKLQGQSAGGRDIHAFLVSHEADFLKHGRTNEGKLNVLLVGGQHGTEPSGTEALQFIARELLDGRFSKYLAEMNFILITNANPDGRDNRRRVNEDGVNLSTDYVVLSQPESQVMIKVLRDYQPHLVLDVHESAILKKKSLGAQGFLTDFQAQFEFANHPNVESKLQAFMREEFLPEIVDGVNAKGLPAGRYIGEITDVNQRITHGGITPRNFRNYAGMTGALSILLENRLDPKEGVYPTPRNIAMRVDNQIRSITVFLDRAKAERKTILNLVAAARNQPGSSEIYLTAEYVVDPQQPDIIIPLRRRDNGKLIQKKFEYRSQIKGDEALVFPHAYLVTKHQKQIGELLDRHGIEYVTVKQPAERTGVIQKIESIKRIPKRKSGFKLQVSVSERVGKTESKTGDLLITLDHLRDRLVPLLFDPRSSTGIFQAPDFGEFLAEGDDFFIVRFNPPQDEEKAAAQ